VNAVSGTVEKGFETVREGFAEGQKDDSGGAQLCIYRDGKKVVDLWTGLDKVNNRPYTEDTLTVLMSCTKGAVATMVHMLAERGELDIDERVAHYWPEFEQNGKADARVRHLLSHTVGLNVFGAESGMSPHDLLNWTRCTTALAEMAPAWEPGAAVMYHAVTYGYLVGEIIRRVSGRTPGQFFTSEIAKPLDLQMWIGLPERQEHRVSPHFSERPPVTPVLPDLMKSMLMNLGIDPDSRVVRSMIRTGTEVADAIEITNSREGHAAEIPAINAIGNARSLARMYAATIGEVDGVRLLNAATMKRARTWQTQDLKAAGDVAKLPAPDPQRMALGYGLPRACEPMLGEGSFGHAGAGGRRGFAHPESGVAVGYVGNNMSWDPLSGRPDPRWVPWNDALQEALGL
jgi:CubicO group peptidase (beta-lactamase class C family)